MFKKRWRCFSRDVILQTYCESLACTMMVPCNGLLNGLKNDSRNGRSIACASESIYIVAELTQRSL